MCDNTIFNNMLFIDTEGKQFKLIELETIPGSTRALLKEIPVKISQQPTAVEIPTGTTVFQGRYAELLSKIKALDEKYEQALSRSLFEIVDLGPILGPIMPTAMSSFNIFTRAREQYLATINSYIKDSLPIVFQTGKRIVGICDSTFSGSADNNLYYETQVDNQMHNTIVKNSDLLSTLDNKIIKMLNEGAKFVNDTWTEFHGVVVGVNYKSGKPVYFTMSKLVEHFVSNDDKLKILDRAIYSLGEYYSNSGRYELGYYWTDPIGKKYITFTSKKMQDFSKYVFYPAIIHDKTLNTGDRGIECSINDSEAIRRARLLGILDKDAKLSLLT